MPSLNDLWQGYLSQNASSIQSRAIMAALEQPALVGLTQLTTNASRLMAYNVYNPNTAPAFLQLFNAASVGVVTLGTTTPVKQIAVPTGGVLDGTWDFGPSFPLGIVAAATTAQKGSTAVTTGLALSLGTV